MKKCKSLSFSAVFAAFMLMSVFTFNIQSVKAQEPQDKNSATMKDSIKLKAGDKAPDFSSTDQDGNKVTLSQFKGKKVILYFYPKDDTPGCTAEACSLRDGKKELEDMGFVILGVSPDSEQSHRDFIEKHGLNFTLLADTEKTIAISYGVWGEKKMYGKTYIGISRTTFIIDGNGAIEKIFDKVDTKNHFEQIADSYK